MQPSERATGSIALFQGACSRTGRVVIAVGALVIAAILLPALVGTIDKRVGQRICEWKDGKWAGGTCTTRACYVVGDCGVWAHPSYWCPRLKTGDSIAEVYFQLGHGAKVVGNIHTWSDKGGTESDPRTTVTIENQVVTAVSCP